MIDFHGQVAIVTGAGRGLGRQYALDLARRGAQVVVNDIGGSMSGDGTDSTVANAVVDEITAAGGIAVASHASVDSPEGGAAIVQSALDAFGRVDAVISNAGIYETVPFEDLSVERWRLMLQVHLHGTFHVTQPAFRVMKQQGYGRIVFTASNMAAFGHPENVHYAAAKGGIIGMTHVLAHEGAPHGILVNAVLPIGQTRMMTDSIAEQEEQLDALRRAFFDTCPPERVAPIVTYLASRDCSVTRQLFSAAAGRYARVFVGLGEGWMAPSHTQPSAEDVAAHFDEIAATTPFAVPDSVADEIVALMQRLDLL